MKIIKLPSLTIVEIEHFWKHVNKSAQNGCWEWTRYKTKKGYGQVGFKYKLYLVHRISWFIETGIDPGEKQVCHKCDNPPCVNPSHLFLGTQTDNMQDMMSKHREDHTKNLRGEDNAKAKLNEAQVKEIWWLHLNEGLGERKLGARFNVTPANIHSILSGNTWKHLYPENPIPLVPTIHGRPRVYKQREKL